MGGSLHHTGRGRTQSELAACRERRAEGVRGLREPRRQMQKAGEGSAEPRGVRALSPELAAPGERELPVPGGIEQRGRPVLGRKAAARLPARAGSPHV